MDNITHNITHNVKECTTFPQTEPTGSTFLDTPDLWLLYITAGQRAHAYGINHCTICMCVCEVDIVF